MEKIGMGHPFTLPSNRLLDLDDSKLKSVKIILVRHGTSCANLRRDAVGVKVTMGRSWHYVPDPELTQSGIENAITFGEQLQDKAKDSIVCASMLLRAQMTAYLMMKPQMVHVLPYISEEGNSDDNKPQDLATQQKKLKRNPYYDDIQRNTTYIDGREFKDPSTPNWGNFFEFLKEKYSELSKNSGYFNPSLVIISHGHSIETLLGNATKYGAPTNLKIAKADRPNFAAFTFTFDLDSGKITTPTRYDYLDGSGLSLSNSTADSVEKDCQSQRENPVCSADACGDTELTGEPFIDRKIVKRNTRLKLKGGSRGNKKSKHVSRRTLRKRKH